MQLEYIDMAAVTCIHGLSEAGCQVLALLSRIWLLQRIYGAGRVTRCQPCSRPSLCTQAPAVCRLAWESPIRRPIDRQSALIIVVNDLHHSATPLTRLSLYLLRGWSTVAAYIRLHRQMTFTSAVIMDRCLWCKNESLWVIRTDATARVMKTSK